MAKKLGLEREGRKMGRAVVSGRLIDLGQYPGLRPARSRSETVGGFVWEIESKDLWKRLDQYEDARPGGEYRRVMKVALMSRTQRRIKVWAYLYAKT